MFVRQVGHAICASVLICLLSLTSLDIYLHHLQLLCAMHTCGAAPFQTLKSPYLQ